MSAIINVYVDLIKKGLKTKEDITVAEYIPLQIKEQILQLLAED